jgi:hypothetical protein
VFESLGGCSAGRGLDGEENVEERQAGGGEGRVGFPQAALVRLLRLEDGGVGQPAAAPVLVAGGAAQFEDLVQLLHLASQKGRGQKPCRKIQGYARLEKVCAAALPGAGKQGPGTGGVSTREERERTCTARGSFAAAFCQTVPRSRTLSTTRLLARVTERKSPKSNQHKPGGASPLSGWP